MLDILYSYVKFVPRFLVCQWGNKINELKGCGIVDLKCTRIRNKALADFEAERQKECLAMNIYHEARGEPDQGKEAVGYCIYLLA